MKRILSLGLALLVVSASLLSLTACSSSGDEEVEVQTTLAAVYTESAVPVEKSSETVGKNLSKGAIPTDSLKVTKAGQEEVEEIDSSLSAINDAAKAVKDLMLENIEETSGDIPFGSDNTDVVLVQGENFASKLTVDDVKYATMTEVGDKYYITIEFNDISEAEAKEILSKAFNLRDKADILNSEEFAKTKAYLELKDYSVNYTGCKITATVNRLTNKIETVNYFKAANVTASALGKGTFEAHGDLSILFTLEDNAYYELNWENEDPTSPLETTEVTTEIITEVMTDAIPKVSKAFEQ